MSLFIQELKKLLVLTKADPKSLAAGIIAPTIILVIFALTFGNFVALKLAVVDDDAGDLGTAFQEAVFSQTSPLSGEPYFEAIEADADEAARLYEQGRVNGILTIPEDFSERLTSGASAQIIYAFDNYNTDMAKNLRLYLDEGIFAFYQSHMPGMEIEVQREYAVGAQLDWFAIIAVGVFMLAFLMGSMFNFLYLLNKERVYATLSEYRLAPVSLLPTFAARIVVALLAGALGAGVNALLILLLTGVNLANCLLAILPVLLVLGVAFISFAAIVSLTVRKFSGAAMLSMVTAVVAWFLSGATTSVKYATGVLLDVALALPSSYGLSQIRAAVFSVDQSVGGLLAAGKGWLVMGTYAIVLATVAWFVYRKRLGGGAPMRYALLRRLRTRA